MKFNKYLLFYTGFISQASIFKNIYCIIIYIGNIEDYIGNNFLGTRYPDNMNIIMLIFNHIKYNVSVIL